MIDLTVACDNMTSKLTNRTEDFKPILNLFHFIQLNIPKNINSEGLDSNVKYL